MSAADTPETQPPTYLVRADVRTVRRSAVLGPTRSALADRAGRGMDAAAQVAEVNARIAAATAHLPHPTTTEDPSR